MKKRVLTVFVVVGIAAGGSLQAQTAAEPLTRQWVIAEVLKTNPNVTAAQAAWDGAREAVRVAGFLDDPVLSSAIAPLTIDDNSIGFRTGVSQVIPWPGRLDVRQSRAEALADQRRWNLESIRLGLALEASELFNDWYLIHRALDLNTHHLDLANNLKASAETRYVAGAATQQDPLQAEVRLTRLQRGRLELESRRRTTQARINSMMHRPPGSPLPPPPDLLDLPASRSLDLDHRGQPLYEAALARVRTAEAELRLAELETRPDVMAMAEYSTMFMDDHRLMTGISVRLPVRKSRIQAAIAVARADVAEARSTAVAASDQLDFEVESARLDLQNALEIVRIYQDHLVPASNDQSDAAQIGFTTGRSSFSSLVDAEKNLEEIMLGYHEALTDAWTAAARVAVAAGLIPFIAEETSDDSE